MPQAVFPLENFGARGEKYFALFIDFLRGAWYLAAGALFNTVLFLAVSIPMAEKRQSRKMGFDAYKKQTRMLLPIKK